jgi:hypothetical protein
MDLHKLVSASGGLLAKSGGLVMLVSMGKECPD